MKSTFVVILGLLAVSLLATTAVCADPTWGDCILTMNGTQTVKLSPTYAQSGSGWIYTYVVNNTSTVDISGFTLTLPSVVSPNSCTSIAFPTGWALIKRPSFGQLFWQNFTGNDIAPGGAETFQFSTAFGPSYDKPATGSVTNALGFSGAIYSPVPEPSSIIVLLGGLGSLLAFRRRKA